jgi:hypothetical protein
MYSALKSTPPNMMRYLSEKAVFTYKNPLRMLLKCRADPEPAMSRPIYGHFLM